MTLKRYATSSGLEVGSHPMTLDAASGVWSVTGDAGWDRQFYLFDVEVYVPGVDAVVSNLVTDPYSVSLSQDGEDPGDVRSQFVNLADGDLKPTGWDTLSKPALANFEDIVVYEVHVRDFSANDSTVAAGDRGTYKAFTYDGTGPHPNATPSDGMNHLQQLQQAGLTHIHLLPAFDIATIVEPVAERTEPDMSFFNPATQRATDDAQTEVGDNRATDSFNWGYDPHHYGVPEGSYSTNPDGVTRILEFRDMVSALNQNGLRVVMDVVYNHTAASGQGDKSVLDKVVPDYYHRYDANGTMYNSSCCDDTATEYEMMEKLMIDTLVRFAVDASGQIVGKELAAMDAFAIYAGSPLAVMLASFEAQAQAGHVLVSWETVSELNNAGFNLYRTGSVGDRPEQGDLLAFVPSQAPGAAQGAAYRFQDSNVVSGQTYWYWLEDVELNGATTLHGPVSVTYAAPTAVTLSAVQVGSAGVPALPVVLVLLALVTGMLLAGIHASRRTLAR